jgi:formylglycine-generating enzyme required for sulfatase activity
MHKAILILLLTSLTISNCFAQNHSKIYGTSQIDDITSMTQTEVTIEEWMGFIACNDFDTSLFPDEETMSPLVKILFQDLKRKSNFKYLELVENNNSVKKYFGDKSIKATHNFKLLKAQFDDFVSIRIPVTGISFEQVKRFCRWKEKTINQSQGESKKLKVQLPTIELYTKLIGNIDSVCNTKKCDSCTMYKFNYNIPKSRLLKCDKSNVRQGQTLLRVDAYWATGAGLYNLQGNAAEMTATEGIAMGGSFRHTARESYNDQRQAYTKPQDWLGFRYVVTTR